MKNTAIRLSKLQTFEEPYTHFPVFHEIKVLYDLKNKKKNCLEISIILMLKYFFSIFWRNLT